MTDKKEDIKETKENKETKEEAKTDSETQKILSMSELSLWLDTYDDIFSDFDPRPFTQRSLSVDFLDEIKRASRDKVSGQIELRFLIPEKDRNAETESQIKKRLKEYFKKHYEQSKGDIKKIIKTGLLVAALGFLLMFFSIMLQRSLGDNLIETVLVTLFEPSGWFLMFYGLDNTFYSSRSKRPEMEFHSKMAKAEISFISY